MHSSLAVKLSVPFLCSQVAWIHVGRQMLLTVHKHVVVKIPRFSVSHDNQKTWLLHISSVQQDDRGYYMCQVNTNPMISQVGFLQVVGKYRFTLRRRQHCIYRRKISSTLPV